MIGLGKTLEKIILQRICDAYHKEQEAKRSELELIALLEEEDFLGGAGGKGSSGTKASKASKAAAIAVSKSTPPLLSAGTVTKDSLGKQKGKKVESEPKQEQEPEPEPEQEPEQEQQPQLPEQPEPPEPAREQGSRPQLVQETSEPEQAPQPDSGVSAFELNQLRQQAIDR